MSRDSTAFCAAGGLADDGPRVKLFHMVPMKPGFPYESCSDDLLFILSGSDGRFRASRLPNRCAADDLRRPEGSVIEESEPRRSASCLGASGMAGTALSPKALWLWLEYFWWNGEGIVDVLVVAILVEDDFVVER